MQALEGKDIKDLLVNVGSGGGAATAPAAGGAAPGGAAAAEEEKEEEKEEGAILPTRLSIPAGYTDKLYSQGGIRRGYGFRSFRLSASPSFLSVLSNAWPRSSLGAVSGWLAAIHR